LIALFLISQRKYRKQTKKIFFFIIGFLCLFVPYISVNYKAMFVSTFQRSLIGTTEIPSSKKIIYFWRNLYRTFLAFYYNSKVGHFVSGSLLDTVSGILLSLGLIYLFLSWRKCLFLFLTLLVLLIMIGGLSQYPYVSDTRAVFILPILSLIAGIGLKQFSELLRNKISAQFSLLMIVFVLTVILSLNLYRFYWQTPKKMQLTTEALIIKAIQSSPDCQKGATIVYPSPEPLLQPALESYGFLNKARFIKKREMNGKEPMENSCLIVALDDQVTILPHQ
jgi:hypothetical protein